MAEKSPAPSEPRSSSALAFQLPNPVETTSKVLDLMQRQQPEKAAFFMMLMVELQALVDGQITFTNEAGKEQAMTPAQACSAIVHCARNGMSVAAGHVIPLGNKLYTTPAGYLASAEWRGDFLGFGKVRAMTEEEKAFMGISPDPWDGLFLGEGAGKKPKGKRFSCAVAVEARRKGFDEPSIGYGWWDREKDSDNKKSVPAQTATSRARRRALMALYGLGIPRSITDDADLEPEDVPGQRVIDVSPGMDADLPPEPDAAPSPEAMGEDPSA